jgi:hypothetical protein
MLGFPRFRNKYKGPVNKIAYLGMAGDIIVIVGLYALYKERKTRKEVALPEIQRKQVEENL